MQTENPFDAHLSTLEVDGQTFKYYDLHKLNDPRVAQLPVSIKVLLECAMRNCNGFSVKKEDV
jgi:aconitate hydratase